MRDQRRCAISDRPHGGQRLEVAAAAGPGERTDHAGENLAGLYSLIATCEASGVNPVDYLADVLMRVQTHPASRIDELLPQNWNARANSS